MDPIKTTIKSYDEVAEEYCEKTLECGNREFQEKMLKKTLDMLPDAPRMVDLGCGDGRDTAFLKKKGADVVGIDLSAEMVDLARRKHREDAFFQEDMRDTIFPDDTFHGAWASASIINLPKPELSKVESEVYRILEPNGLFAFSFKVGESEGFEEDSVIEGYPRYFSYYTLEELDDRLSLFDILDTENCPENIFGSEFMYCWARSRK